VLALTLFGAFGGSSADDRSSPWTSIAPGLWYRAWPIPRGGDARAAKAHVFRADPRVVHVAVIDARTQARSIATVEQLRSESGAYVVVNGGFFDEHERPLGLVVSDSKETSPLRKVDQGIFLIAGGKPAIQHSRDPLPYDIDVALQSGPRLVVGGRPLTLKPQASRRTSICLPGDGTVTIVTVPVPIELSDLAASLVLSAAEGGLGCWEALNLDGGPSTQLSAATPTLNLEVAGGWGVPNGLAILPTTTAPQTPTH
jgi:uncharacterized protein YigE (DUF2233 family)